MEREKSEDIEGKENAYFYEEHIKCMLPKDNIHKDVIDVENLIHGFASIPLYDRVGIPIDDLPDEMRQEMESSAAMHYKKYLEKRSSTSHSAPTKTVAQPKKNKAYVSNPSESLIRGLYGRDFSSDCLKYLKSHSTKPFPLDDIVFDDTDMVEVTAKDNKLWKKEFDEFVCRFDGDPNRSVAIISSEESDLSEEFDEGYVQTYEMAERLKRLGEIINASASVAMKEKCKEIPSRTLNMDFDNIPCVTDKPYPHEIPNEVRNFELSAEERARRRIQRNKIRKEREMRRLQRLSLTSSVQDDQPEELLPHPMMEAPNASTEPKEKKKTKKAKESSSSSDDEDLKLLEWKANKNTKSNLAKDKRKRGRQIDKSLKKKGL